MGLSATAECGNRRAVWIHIHLGEFLFFYFFLWTDTHTSICNRYNRATSPEKYTSVKDLLHELVSVVARGGNFLLNVGPEASGRIPAVMAERVRGMGAWLHVNGEALFDTEPYWAAFQDKAEPSQPLVFTRKKDGGAFYIISLERPGPRLVVKAPVYNFFGPDATVRLLGASQILPWTRFSNGRLAVEVPRAVADQGEHVWIFKVEHTP